ncbi:MAG TPA: NAD(P)-binding domain-containing protein [Polyangiaceae bacterium LLY-WYZ-15_(1-7)]|nr:NAD(P)-binding domain-containing protein [Polyangiaceae bacterium LLY-WYZ-15_(1-7)]
MDIAILGNGNVGEALGGAWGARGHTIHFGVLDPSGEAARASVAKGGAGASAGTAQEVVDRAELVVIALPWGVTREVLGGLEGLDGKIVVDCTLPLVRDEGGMRLELGHGDSGAERVQAAAPGARVVKTLGQVGFETMADAARLDGAPVMFLAGDDAGARETVGALLEAIGFEAGDVGELRLSRLLEPYGMLWVHLAFRAGLGRDFAFGLRRARSEG